MSKLENFKNFVGKNPILIKHVKDGSMTWQKFYEIYDLYGENESAWSTYLKKEEVKEEVKKVSSVGDIIGLLKNIDLDKLQDSINSVQKVLGVFGDMVKKDDTVSSYKPRPLYKHFDD